jgi:hypothetical protein
MKIACLEFFLLDQAIIVQPFSVIFVQILTMAVVNKSCSVRLDFQLDG